jgi:hypothetical protein
VGFRDDLWLNKLSTKKKGFLVKGNFNRKKMYGWMVANSKRGMYNQRKKITSGCFAADFKGTVLRDFFYSGFFIKHLPLGL